MTLAIEAVRQVMEDLIPFNQYLGIKVRELDTGRALLELPFRPELIGDPMRPALHGGVLAALLDTCGGAAVWTRIDVHDRVSTIDLRVDYLRPGLSQLVLCEGKLVRAGRHVGVASLTAWHESAPESPIATGTGVYSIKRHKEK